VFHYPASFITKHVDESIGSFKELDGINPFIGDENLLKGTSDEGEVGH
jgi:hypothetical protein